MGLGQRTHGGAGHYEWFNATDWDKDSNETQKAELDKVEGSITNSVLLLPKKKQPLVFERNNSSLEPLNDYNNKTSKSETYPRKAAIKSSPKKANLVKVSNVTLPLKPLSPIKENGTVVKHLPAKKDSKVSKESNQKFLKKNVTNEFKAEKEVKILAPILTPLVALERVWRANEGGKVLLVDLNSLRSPKEKWSERMATVLLLGGQADYVFIAGNQELSRNATPYLKDLGAKINVSSNPSISNKYLVGEVSKLKGIKVQLLLFSNTHALSQLSSKGRLTVANPQVDTMSRILAENADAILDLALLDNEEVVQENNPKVLKQGKAKEEVKIKGSGSQKIKGKEKEKSKHSVNRKQKKQARRISK